MAEHLRSVENWLVASDLEANRRVTISVTSPLISIDHSNQSIKRLDFLYDNDKGYTAGAVKKVDFNSKDVDGKDCIEYSSKTQGVQRVYREDLAAIGITYEDDTYIAQKLMTGVVFGGMSARIQRKSVKTEAGE